MGVYETYSKRKKARERAGEPDVYQYDDLPEPFRVQVTHIWRDAIGLPSRSYDYKNIADGHWARIHGILSRELGVNELATARQPLNDYGKCLQFLMDADTDNALDIIEISFKEVQDHQNQYQLGKEITLWKGDAIDELNHRFREHLIGYQFESGQIIRVDSQYTHHEVVKPAIQLLTAAAFAGPEEEFLKAHEHYRHGRNKEAIADALKSFESTMKAICDRRKWPYKPGAAAKELIQVVFDHGLVPGHLQSEFTALRSVLESGLPTARNKLGGHGQGSTPIEVPDYLSAYALHLAGSNIQLLVEADKALK